jgi:hypothetical protein
MASTRRPSHDRDRTPTAVRRASTPHLPSPPRAALDLRLTASAQEAFDRLARQAGLAFCLVGRKEAFEVVATPVLAPELAPGEDEPLVRCVLRGRFHDAARGSYARARLLVRPYWRGAGRAAGAIAWVGGLHVAHELERAGEGPARLRRQQRVMLRMWSTALGPVVGADLDDPFRGMVG